MTWLRESLFCFKLQTSFSLSGAKTGGLNIEFITRPEVWDVSEKTLKTRLGRTKSVAAVRFPRRVSASVIAELRYQEP